MLIFGLYGCGARNGNFIVVSVRSARQTRFAVRTFVFAVITVAVLAITVVGIARSFIGVRCAGFGCFGFRIRGLTVFVAALN